MLPQVSLPLLEDAFTNNPYPTRSEKELLARKTRLQYKQVHTWVRSVSWSLLTIKSSERPVVSKPQIAFKEGL